MLRPVGPAEHRQLFKELRVANKLILETLHTLEYQITVLAGQVDVLVRSRSKKACRRWRARRVR